MWWSTRELAELAGTTLKTVRHYHEIGLLAEPERSANGYKQYRTTHLVRLVQIKRLRDLGVPLAQVGAMVAEGADSSEALRAQHRELGATIERLQRMRDELADILEHQVPLDAPAEFAGVSAELGSRDRALVTVLARVLGPEQLDDLRQLASERDGYEDELDALPADADDATIDGIAERMAVALARDRARFPWMRDPAAGAPRGKRFAESMIAPAIRELYNTAQLKVLVRAVARLQEDDGPAAEA